MKLIVGLGNPGGRFENTRHNVGFDAVKALADDSAEWKSFKSALVYKDEDVLYAMPMTFMNESGIAVKALMDFYKIPVENITVIHDELDLKPGDVREKTAGGDAGHNGIKSIDSLLGKDYKRIRIGIGHPRDFIPDMDPSDWVLSKFSVDERKVINAAIEKIKEIV
jgi:PTH1 family peptidyl-tRNA hydrolase